LDDGFRRSIPSACAFAAVAYSPIASHAAKHLEIEGAASAMNC
jgi:hypothetical protein